MKKFYLFLSIIILISIGLYIKLPNILLPLEKDFYNRLSSSNYEKVILLAEVTNFSWDEVCIYPNIDDSHVTGIDEFLDAWKQKDEWKKSKNFLEAPLFPFNKTYRNVLFFKLNGKIVHVIRTTNAKSDDGEQFVIISNNFCGASNEVKISRIDNLNNLSLEK